MAVREHGLFRKVDHPGPDVAKGGCYYDGSAGPGVDTGILVEFEGTLFFSLQAIKEMAEVAGFTVNEEAIKLEHDNAFLQEHVTALEGQIKELTEQLEAVGLAVAAAARVQAETARPQYAPKGHRR